MESGIFKFVPAKAVTSSADATPTKPHPPQSLLPSPWWFFFLTEDRSPVRRHPIWKKKWFSSKDPKRKIQIFMRKASATDLALSQVTLMTSCTILDQQVHHFMCMSPHISTENTRRNVSTTIFSISYMASSADLVLPTVIKEGLEMTTVRLFEFLVPLVANKFRLSLRYRVCVFTWDLMRCLLLKTTMHHVMNTPEQMKEIRGCCK